MGRFPSSMTALMLTVLWTLGNINCIRRNCPSPQLQKLLHGWKETKAVCLSRTLDYFHCFFPHLRDLFINICKFTNVQNSPYTDSLMALFFKAYLWISTYQQRSLVHTPFWLLSYKNTRKSNKLEAGMMVFCPLWSPVSWCYPETKDTPKAIAAFILSTPVADTEIFKGLEYRSSSLHLLFSHITHAPVTMIPSSPVTSLEWG